MIWNAIIRLERMPNLSRHIFEGVGPDGFITYENSPILRWSLTGTVMIPDYDGWWMELMTEFRFINVLAYLGSEHMFTGRAMLMSFREDGRSEWQDTGKLTYTRSE